MQSQPRHSTRATKAIDYREEAWTVSSSGASDASADSRRHAIITTPSGASFAVASAHGEEQESEAEDSEKGKGKSKAYPSYLHKPRTAPNAEALALVTPDVWAELDKVRKPGQWASMSPADKEKAGQQLLSNLDIVVRPYLTRYPPGSDTVANLQQVNGEQYGLSLANLKKVNKTHYNWVAHIFDRLSKQQEVPKSTRDQLTKLATVRRIAAGGGEFSTFVGTAALHAEVMAQRTMETLISVPRARAATEKLGASLVRALDAKGLLMDGRLKSDLQRFVKLSMATVSVLQPIIADLPTDWISLTNPMQNLNSLSFWPDGSTFAVGLAKWAINQGLDYFKHIPEEEVDPKAAEPVTHSLLPYHRTSILPDAGTVQLDSPQFRLFRLFNQLQAIEDASAHGCTSLPCPQPDEDSISFLSLPRSELASACLGPAGVSASDTGSAALFSTLVEKVMGELTPTASAVPLKAVATSVLEHLIASMDLANWEDSNPDDMEALVDSVDAHLATRIYASGISGLLDSKYRSVQVQTKF